MSIDSNIADELATSGAPTFKFEDVGDTIAIRIEGVKKSQVTDFQTGEPQFWPNGDPKVQFEISGIDTQTGEATRIFAKSYMLTAVREAFQKAEAKPEVGGVLTVRYDEAKPSKTRGMSPSKLFKAKYEPPVAEDLDDLGEF